MANRREYYVVRIGSWKGDDTGREQYSAPQPVDEIYAIISVAGDRAVIVDDGYRSPTEARKAWPEALYGAAGP